MINETKVAQCFLEWFDGLSYEILPGLAIAPGETAGDAENVPHYSIAHEMIQDRRDFTIGAFAAVWRMARKLRVEYEGAIYHVMNPGDQREAIFLNDEDRHLCIKAVA